jgi:hypothetical protein
MKTSSPSIVPAELSDLFTTDVMAIRELPRSQDEISMLRAAISLKLWSDFLMRLSDAERDSLKQPQGFDSIIGKWDCYILEAAQQFGARLFLTDLVMNRVWSWQCGEKDGTSKLENLFHEIHRSALIGLKQAKGKITDRHRASRNDFVKELTELQIKVRVDWPETPDAVRRCVGAAIDKTPATFQYLKTNKGSLLVFLGDDQIAMKFRGADFKRVKGDLTPVRFFDQWVASAENRDPETVRQDLGSL